LKTIFFLCCLSLTLFAHKLNLFLDYGDDKLFIYSYFGSGFACKGCKIELFDANNQLLKTLKTDQNGEYYLKDYNKVKYVKVEALGGHMVKEKIDSTSTKIKGKHPILESMVAIVLIILIFIGLKRIKQ